MVLEQPNLTLEELAQKTGISRNTVQFYLQSRLIDPPQEDDPERGFTPDHILRIAAIQKWLAEGKTVESIRQGLHGFRNPWFTQMQH